MTRKRRSSVERTLYAEHYRKRAARIRPECLPVLTHVAPGFTVHEAYLETAGRAECPDGVIREFQVIRVYFNEVPLDAVNPS